MRVLITGAEGFTGHYAAAEFDSAGHEVHAFVRHPATVNGARAVYVADLNSPADLRRVMDEVRPEWVVHLAGIAFVAHGDI